MPGDDERKIRKALTLGADAVCMDLEDGVALNRKAQAREVVLQALHTFDFGHSEKLVRINPVSSGVFLEDLRSILPGQPDGIVLPKTEAAEHVRRVSMRIGELEHYLGFPVGAIHMIVIVETASGIVNLREIANADRRVQAIVFGAEDFAGDIGAKRSQAGWEVFYGRSAVVTHAAACGLQAIDMVYVDYQDTEGLRVEAQQGADLGFSGKQVIHPAQIEPVQGAFTPDAVSVQAAFDLIAAFEKHQEIGVGAFAYQGKMVDAPMVRMARQIITRARAAGADNTTD
jgi:citrate lyase beta subunit